MKSLKDLDFSQVAANVTKLPSATQAHKNLFCGLVVMQRLVAVLNGLLAAAGPQPIMVPIPVRVVSHKRGVM